MGLLKLFINIFFRLNMHQLIFERDKIYPYPWYFADEALTCDIKKIFGRKINKIILEFKDGRFYYYGDASEFDLMGEFLLEKVKEDRKFYKVVQKNILATGKELIRFCEKIKGIDLTKVSDKKLVDLYINYAKKIKKVRIWGWVPPLIDGTVTYFLTDYVQSEFKKFMESQGKADKISRYFSILSSSEKMSEVQKEEIARLMIVGKIEKADENLINFLEKNSAKAFLDKIKKEYRELYGMIKKHAEKFVWLPYAYIGPGLNEEGVINLINDALNNEESVEEQIKNINNHYKKLPEQKRKIIKEINLSDDLKYIFGIYAFFMHLKDLRKGVYQQSYVAMDPVIKEISGRIGLTFQEAKYLTAEEIGKALLNNKNFRNIAGRRTKYCLALIENGKISFLNDSEIKKIKKSILTNRIDKNVKEIKGMTAFAGKVRGIAKIIEVVKDMPKLEEGEILISPATNPDLVPAMKKAGAFVTDTGGITCHAAIVSREMKKPCVTGTKIATKIIKDGDLIEVDADNGVVRIIKKYDQH